MKKRHILLIASLVLAGLLLVFLLTINRIENQTDDQWSHIHMHMTDELTVNFPISKADQPCVFQWETGRGSFSAEITDAEGAVLYSTASEKSGSDPFLASSDLTLRINAKGHGGVFSLMARDDLVLEPQDPEAEPEPYLLVDGNHYGGQFTRSYHCLKFDGKKLNFYVENKGSGPVLITINGSYSRTIPAGGSGHISAPISATILPQEMTVKCVTASGDDIDIYWKVAQR